MYGGEIMHVLCLPHHLYLKKDFQMLLTPDPNIRITRASHEFQYIRYLAYSEALKNSFFPRTISVWNSLPSSLVSSKTPEEFKALI